MSVDSSVRFSLLSTDGVENNEARFSLGARYRHFSPTMNVQANLSIIIRYILMGQKFKKFNKSKFQYQNGEIGA